MFRSVLLKHIRVPKLFCPECSGGSVYGGLVNCRKPTLISFMKDSYMVRERSTTVGDSEENALTPDEAAKVLKIVNDVQRSEDLLKFFIPKKKADELVKRKVLSDGSRQMLTLEEVVSIVGPKNSNKFFCSILDKPIPISINAAMFPVVTSNEIKRFSNVLSLIIVGDRISWAVVERTGNSDGVALDIKAMRQISYPFKPRMHFLTLLKEMEIVTKQIPECEVFLVEEYPTTVPTPYMFTFHLQMSQAKSMLLGLLNSRVPAPTIVSIKTVAVARLFNTYVGSEKVSGQHLVDDMLVHKKLPFIRVQDSVSDTYTSLDAKVKEGLSQAFLLNLAYWKMTQQVN